MCYQMLAARSLKEESMKVYRELKKEDLEGSRHAVSMIVGRDTQNLTFEGVTKAAVETVAENTSDGEIAPLFYMALGGPPLLYLYKTINTMDSMVGYKNDRFLNFGRYGAKLDDVVNYIPARISALLMITAAWITGMDEKTPGRFLKETGITMQALIQPRQNQPWPGLWISSLQEMPIILESCMRSLLWEIRNVLWS